MNFAQLHEALRLDVLRRIERGGLSGKLLAAQTGFKQAHISNFLNRRRMLSLAGMDSVLNALKIDVSDLMPGGIANPSPQPAALPAPLRFDTVPLVLHAVAIKDRHIVRTDVMATIPLMPGTLSRFSESGSSSRRNWQRFVAIRVTEAQAAAMQPILHRHAILLLDRRDTSLSGDGETPALYAVNTGAGLAIRYVTMKSNRLLLRCYSHTQPIALLEPPPGRPASELIVGRVCQILAEV